MRRRNSTLGDTKFSIHVRFVVNECNQSPDKLAKNKLAHLVRDSWFGKESHLGLSELEYRTEGNLFSHSFFAHIVQGQVARWILLCRRPLPQSRWTSTVLPLHRVWAFW